MKLPSKLPSVYFVSLTVRNPNPAARASAPISPIRGSKLPVLGNSLVAGSVGAAAGCGGGVARAIITTSIGWSAGGGGGGGGIVPVNCFWCSTTVSGSSTTLVAEIFIPCFRPNASVSWPFTLNFWPLGILKRSVLPSASFKITEFGGVTCQTVPVTVWTVVTVLGVVVVVIVRCSFIPGFSS